MKKFFINLVMVVSAVASQACATHGYTGFTGLSFPGYEAVGLAAANSAMSYQILAAAQPGWIYHGQPSGSAPAGYQWVCRSKSFMHKLGDASLAALAGSFLGWREAGFGAGVGGYAAQHEKDCYLVSISVQTPSSFLVRVMNSNQTAAMLFDGVQEVGTIPAGRQVDLPPAMNGYRAVLTDSAGRPSGVEAELIQPDPQKRFLEIRPRSP